MEKVDVIIIGAGIAGITTAYYLQKNFPKLHYKIIESRSDLNIFFKPLFFLMAQPIISLCTQILLL